MCSSPKSSRSVAKSTSKALFVTMDSNTRAKFAEVANRAQERKEQRELLAKAKKNASKPLQKKASPLPKKCSGFMGFLSQVGFSV